MNRKQALDILTRFKPELTKRFGVTSLALFGSTVRDKATEDSDIDIVVSFDASENASYHVLVAWPGRILEAELQVVLHLKKVIYNR